MTVRFSLFDFMPYGAPELQAAARPNMLRAQGVACGFVTLLFALAWITISRLPHAVEMPAPSIIIDAVPAPPAFVPPRLAPVRPAVVPRHPDFGAIKQVIDEVAPDHPVATDVQDSPPVITGSTHSTGTAGSARAENGISEEPLPTRETYVYVDELPVALFRATPIYPAFAQDAGFDGKVVVHMLVGKDGHVLRAEVDEKLHAPLLDAAALEAALRWEFRPALVNSHPVAVWVTAQFAFRLH